MFNVLRSLRLRLLSLQSLLVLSVCSYYFVGMQVSTSTNINSEFLILYKVSFIVGILVLFLLFFSLHHRPIISLVSTRSGILTVAIWLVLTLLTRQPSLIFMFILAVTFYKKDYRSMCGYLFLWISLLFAVFSVLSFFGLITSGEILKYNLLIDYSDYETVTALGMGNPNTAMSFLLGAVMSGSYIFYDTKYKKRFGVVSLLVVLLVYMQVKSRTGLVGAVVFLFFYFFNFRRVGSLLRFIMPSVMICVFVCSILVGLRFGKSDNLVNDFLTTRPYQWNLRLDNGALTNIVGNSDKFISVPGDRSERYPLDNQYIYLLSRAGWLSLVGVFYLYTVGLKKNRSDLVAYMAFTSILYSFVESLMFTAVTNIGLIIILSSLLFRDIREVA